MANLLTPQDVAEVLSAVQDTTDTFFQQSITFRTRRARKLTAFNDSRVAGAGVQEVVVPGLYVPGQDLISTEASGAADLTRGYVLCNRTDLAAAGLAAAGLADAGGNLLVVPATDTVVVAGEELQLEAAIPVGPLQGVFTLGKFLTRKILKS